MSEVLPKAWESLINSSALVPVIVRSIERYQDSSGSAEPSVHEHFEMIYIKRGEALLEIDGDPVLLRPNDIIIVKPHRHHRMVVKPGKGCEHTVLSFKFENRKDGGISEVSAENFLNFVKGMEYGPYIKLRVNQKNEIITVLNRIAAERSSKEIGSEFLNHLLALQLFVLISRALKMEWENTIREKSGKVKELIRTAVNYINLNYGRDLSLKDIARFVFLSQSYFAKAFKDEIGLSPINYLLKVRIEMAMELLSHTGMKVGDIALNVGFSKQQRFNEIFRKQTGLTPTEFRKKSKIR